MKKWLIVIFAVLIILITGITWMLKEIPSLFVRTLEQQLGRPVRVGSVQFYYPLTLEIKGFEIPENEMFKGESSFSADKIVFRLHPAALLGGRVVIQTIEVRHPQMALRHWREGLYHALSNASKSGKNSSASLIGGKLAGPKPRSSVSLPLVIEHFEIKEGELKVIDYDIQPQAFVVSLTGVNARIDQLVIPPKPDQKTSYRIDARVSQGREEYDAKFHLDGWSRLSDLETDMNFNLNDLMLGYFRPYYDALTKGTLQGGLLALKGNLVIQGGQLTNSNQLELRQLQFAQVPEEEGFFGISLSQLLSSIQARGGVWGFGIVVKWNLHDPSVRPREVIESALKRAVRSSILGNTDQLVQGVVDQIQQKGLGEFSKDIKDSFKEWKGKSESLKEKINNLFD